MARIRISRLAAISAFAALALGSAVMQAAAFECNRVYSLPVTVELPDGTKVDWYLWKGEGRSGIRYGAQNGFVAAAYAPPTIAHLDRPPIIELFDEYQLQRLAGALVQKLAVLDQ